MSSQRESDEPTECGSQPGKEKSPDNVSFKYYDPENIFRQSNTDQDNKDEDNDQADMIGSNNILLSTSFVHSRYSDAMTRYGPSIFKINAGAVGLYTKEDKPFYPLKVKEYYCVSQSIRHVNGEKTTYGHSERRLMRMVLDDLIRGDPESIKGLVVPIGSISENNYLVRPSNIFIKNEKEKEYEIFEHLTDNASQYREYLEKKGLIVKMWSERPACEYEDWPGGKCHTFMNNICPKGSKFGHIAENSFEDSVKDASAKLKDAFVKYHRQTIMNQE